MFSLGQVKRSTVCFGCGGNDIDDESYQSRDMTLEDEPCVILLLYNLADAHGARQNHYCEDCQTERQLIADHLCA